MLRVKSKKGTTLVEVLVASIILGIVVGPMLYFMAYNRATIGEAGCEANANYIIKDWFESVRKLTNLNDVCASGGNIGSRMNEENAEIIKIDNVDYKLYFETAKVTFAGGAASATNPELTQLTAHVKWKYNNKDRHIHMSMTSNN